MYLNLNITYLFSNLLSSLISQKKRLHGKEVVGEHDDVPCESKIYKLKPLEKLVVQHLPSLFLDCSRNQD